MKPNDDNGKLPTSKRPFRVLIISGSDRRQHNCPGVDSKGDALSYLNSLFAGGLCIPKSTRRATRRKNPSVRDLGAGITNRFGGAVHDDVKTHL
jgi:hypothetical protein